MASEFTPRLCAVAPDRDSTCMICGSHRNVVEFEARGWLCVGCIKILRDRREHSEEAQHGK